jgi:hypothetical protein
MVPIGAGGDGQQDADEKQCCDDRPPNDPLFLSGLNPVSASIQARVKSVRIARKPHRAARPVSTQRLVMTLVEEEICGVSVLG